MVKLRNYCFAVGVFLIMLLTACVSGSEDTVVEPLSEGDRLPAFQIETGAGIVTAETLKGIPSVLVFFHTKCPDCQQALPYIQQLCAAPTENEKQERVKVKGFSYTQKEKTEQIA